MTDFIINADLAILNFISEYARNSLFDTVMPVITHTGDGGIIWIIFAILLTIPKVTRKYGLQMTISLILGLLICNITLKPLVGRPRPFILTDTAPLISPPSGYSFPSGHTTSSFAGAMSVLFGTRSLEYSCGPLILAALIGFSRLYLYVHYPTDVLGGILIGTLCGWLSVRIYNTINSKFH